MWQDHPAPHNASPSIHPNLKKNFNPFEILEPQKVHVNSPLIDLSIPGETSYSPITNTVKKEFNNIDLFENILVTPQLVSNQSKNENNIDYDDFFDKIESGTKFDWTNKVGEATLTGAGTSNRTNKPTTQIPERKTNPVMEMDSLFDKLVKNDRRESKYETMQIEYYQKSNVVEEDIIEEVLLDKTLEKMTLRDQSGEKVKVLPIPKLTIIDHKREEHNKINIFLKHNSISNSVKYSNNSFGYSEFKNNNGSDIKIFPKPNILILNKESNLTRADIEAKIKTPDIQTYSLSNSASSSKWNETSAPQINFMALKTLLDDPSLRNDDENSQKSVNRKFSLKEKPINPELLLKDNQKCMIKETKHFTKFNMPCNDSNKDKYTRGPSYEEKLIALPNILDRLNKQKKAYDYKNNMPRRLILDEGAKRRNNVKQIDNLNPIYLKEDCNKDRLVAYKAGKMLESFVNKGFP